MAKRRGWPARGPEGSEERRAELSGIARALLLLVEAPSDRGKTRDSWLLARGTSDSDVEQRFAPHHLFLIKMHGGYATREVLRRVILIRPSTSLT